MIKTICKREVWCWRMGLRRDQPTRFVRTFLTRNYPQCRSIPRIPIVAAGSRPTTTWTTSGDFRWGCRRRGRTPPHPHSRTWISIVHATHYKKMNLQWRQWHNCLLTLKCVKSFTRYFSIVVIYAICFAKEHFEHLRVKPTWSNLYCYLIITVFFLTLSINSGFRE